MCCVFIPYQLVYVLLHHYGLSSFSHMYHNSRMTNWKKIGTVINKFAKFWKKKNALLYESKNDRRAKLYMISHRKTGRTVLYTLAFHSIAKQQKHYSLRFAWRVTCTRQFFVISIITLYKHTLCLVSSLLFYLRYLLLT